MKRLLRWVFHFASLLSALLFAGTCVLWVRSYSFVDYAERFALHPAGVDVTDCAALSSEYGRLTLSREWRSAPAGTPQAVIEDRRTTFVLLKGGWMRGPHVDPEGRAWAERERRHSALYSYGQGPRPPEPWAAAYENRHVLGVISGERTFEDFDFRYRGAGVYGQMYVSVPHAWLAVALAALPAAWLFPRIGRAGRRRRPANRCAACGYDLRSTSDANGPGLSQCPECGSKPVVASDRVDDSPSGHWGGRLRRLVPAGTIAIAPPLLLAIAVLCAVRQNGRTPGAASQPAVNGRPSQDSQDGQFPDARQSNIFVLPGADPETRE